MDLSVIIVNYNVKYYLEQCLRSLFKSADDKIRMEVFVIDNASSDDSVDYIHHKFPRKLYPQLHVISNNRNVGFGRANNQAIAKSKGEYILFLNPDTILTEKTLKESLDFAKKHPDLGGMGTMMLKDGGAFAFESRRGLPTPWVSFCKMSGLSTLLPKSRTFGKYYMRYLDEFKPSEIEIISGAYFLTRRSVIKQVGGFDEDFFMYGEDIDLSYRMILAGYKNYYYPSPILHYKGESTHKSTFKYVHVFYNAMLIFLKKHFKCYWFGLSLPIKIAIILRACLALAGWQMARLKEFLIPGRKINDYKMLYFGRNQQLVKQIAYKWQLDIECIEADELSDIQNPHNKKNSFDFIVYDTQNFSYEYILKTFMKSNHKKYIGTYHPQSQVIITGAKVFGMKNKEKLDKKGGE